MVCYVLLQENLPNPGFKPVSLMPSALADGFFTSSAPGKPFGKTSVLNSVYLIDHISINSCVFFKGVGFATL